MIKMVGAVLALAALVSGGIAIDRTYLRVEAHDKMVVDDHEQHGLLAQAIKDAKRLGDLHFLEAKKEIIEDRIKKLKGEYFNRKWDKIGMDYLLSLENDLKAVDQKLRALEEKK